MKNNASPPKRKRWNDAEIREYVSELREQQKEEPAPAVLRSKINDLAGRLYLDGYTCLEISRLLSMGKCTVYRVLRRKNIYKKKDRSLPKELEEAVVSLYCQGKEAREVSGLLHITVPSVRWILRKNRIPAHRIRVITKREKPDKEVLEKAVRMYSEGIRYRDIEKATGVNNARLYDAIHRSGVPTRGRVAKAKERIAAEEEAIRLYRDTDTYIREIKEKTGVPFTTLRRLLEKRDIPLRGGPGLEEGQIEEAIRLYREGWTNKAIYEKTGVSPSGLTFILQGRGIPLKGRRQPAAGKELQEKVIRMYREGYALEEIRKETGVKSIHDVLKRYNIPGRRRFGQ